MILSSSNPGDIVLDPFFGTGTTGAVAKKLHRRWVGIERDEQYIKVARARIDAIDPALFDAPVFALPNRRDRPRIPFGTLIERGLLRPGQTLYFGRLGEQTATVLANGHLRRNGMVGSIHEVAKAIQGAPCNGWEHWYFLDEQTSERRPIDVLRELVRAEANHDA